MSKELIGVNGSSMVAADGATRVSGRRSLAGRFFSRPAAVGFCGLLVVIALASFIGPYFALSPSEPKFGVLLAPNASHLMGTDSLGRDVFARVLVGGQISLVVGVAVGLLCLTLGIAFGGLAGFFGGALDSALMRVSEFFQVVPGLVLALVATALLGSSMPVVIVILSITMWPGVARLVRVETMKLSELGYVESARAAGFSPLRILVSDVLPNAFAPVLVATTMTVGRAILYESGLSFLGLGNANTPSWGTLLNEAQSFMQTAWWLTVFPGLAIFLVVLAANVLGDLLNDTLNPTLSRVK
ncbi:ABC transporter permease [Arthrobacter sp. FW306-2-2C-D06B]|uniref:ABC transporter permease n=1 Tax=Arthrobacter sp. FW306-2-2C-D06B TaxID=2879618 RepID=UPI001F269E46|nr:ABC transporter permease [Arthrobacter sp. FW306-2-2C-D06B]UKA60469.1 ABC transporter permease [Arthrobacter sp. FW306-2-2C-D06B]UKA60482.1 ABC transporter permease [Arthrobacter sp. FW306-2-2C-D06B]